MQYKTKFILYFLLLTGTICFGQIGGPDGPPLPGNPPPGLPIDGGLTILLAAGAYYGIKKSIKK